jgi:hypothetical protein
VATRLYPASTTTDISPTPAAGWEVTAQVERQMMSTSTASYVMATAATAGSGVANDDTLNFQWIYGPLAAQTLTGTVKGQLGARESNAATDARAQMTIRTIASDGSTVRGTNLAMDTAALSSEFLVDSLDFENRRFPRGGATALTSVSIQAGDYLVLELGFRNHGTNTAQVRMRGSDDTGDTTDLPENETQGYAIAGIYRPWVEFSQTLIPYTAADAGIATGTGAAYVAGKTVKVNTTTSTATGAAYNAAGSLLSPPRTVLINGTDYTESIRLDSFSFTECANRGEVGTGGIDVHDATSALEVPALKAVQFDEPQAGQSNKRVFTGFTHERTTERGIQRAAGVREWGVELVDLNVLADDYVLTASDSADRGSESDYVRVTWLLTSVFGSTGSITAGVVPNSNTVTMEAADYRGRKARDVLAECSEAAGKLWFIYDYGAGRKLYYDLATGTSLSSSAKISDVDTDVNSTTVWAPSTVTVKRSPDRIFSKVHLTYNEGTVTVSNATTATNYRTREVAVLDASITSSALATEKANALLDGAADEIVEVSGLSVVMPALYVNDIRPGQRVEIKLTRHGVSSYTWYRVIRRTVTPFAGSDVVYTVTLGLASNVLAAANGGRGGDEVWPHKSNANDDGATVIVDRSGLRITDGALTLTDQTGETVMQASGFAGSWADFIRLGIYNARLLNGNQGGIQTGYTSDLPYWTVTNTAGSPTKTGVAAGGVTVTFAALNNKATFTSDLVPVTPGSSMEAGIAYTMNRAAGTLTLAGIVAWYKADGTASADPDIAFANEPKTASVTSLSWATSSLTVPRDAFQALLEFSILESGTHNAANSVTVHATKMVNLPVAIPPAWTLNGGEYVTPSGTSDDYDPGDIDNLSLLQADPSATWTLRGIVAPSVKWKLLFLQNYSTANTIVLKPLNAGSAAANQFLTPGNVDFTLSTRSGVLLMYDTTASNWVILTAKS